MSDAALFDLIFTAEGAVPLLWETATRCDCYSVSGTRQPAWGHEECGGLGVRYGDPVEITGLFRGQSRWKSHRASGEHGLGEAQLTLRVAHKPAYTDEHVRDRITVTAAIGDFEAGRVWYPAAQPVPFILAGIQHAWRVQLQGLDNKLTRTVPQP